MDDDLWPNQPPSSPSIPNMKMLMQRKTLADAGIELKQISAIGKGCHT
jgi:hypothetical protein